MFGFKIPESPIQSNFFLIPGVQVKLVEVSFCCWKAQTCLILQPIPDSFGILHFTFKDA